MSGLGYYTKYVLSTIHYVLVYIYSVAYSANTKNTPSNAIFGQHLKVYCTRSLYIYFFPEEAALFVVTNSCKVTSHIKVKYMSELM